MKEPLKSAAAEKPVPLVRALRVLLAICLAELAIIVLLLVSNRMVTDSSLRPPPPARTAGGQEPYYRGRPGPWGQLEFVRIAVEPPDAFVAVEGRSFERTRWYFPQHSPESLTAFFHTCGLTPAQQAAGLDAGAWTRETNAVVVFPDASLILGLSAASRARIYSELATSPQNDFQAWPFTFRNGGFDDWFRGSGLRPETLALVRQLSYTRGPALCFSDLPEVFHRLATTAERRRLLKTLSRNSTLLAKLHVAPDSDIAALTEYWSRAGRAKDIKPLLESLAQVPGGARIDLAHLIPPFARKRLNTFPNPQARPVADCFWTALNFFNDPPDDRYADPAVWQAELASQFMPATQGQLGDIVLLLSPEEVPVHAAVYIADDVVFTKNGGSERQPWLLMDWQDVVARYPSNQALRTLILRRKE